MNNKTLIMAASIAAASFITNKAWAAMNPPDSLSLFAYTTTKDDGRSGLHFAWSAYGQTWQSVGNGFSYVRCDFSRWGTEKKMINPRLIRNANGWECIWQIGRSGKELAIAESSDLTRWKPQRYYEAEDNASLEGRYKAENTPERPETIVLNNDTLQGFVVRVTSDELRTISLFADAKAHQNALYSERMADDAKRFASLKAVKAEAEVDPQKAKAISDNLIGIFFEDISSGADGGLYAELVQNRDFEYSKADRHDWNAKTSWSITGDNATLTIAEDKTFLPNNPHYAVFDTKGGTASLRNEGFDGIALKKGERYDFSMLSKTLDGKGGKLTVSIVDKNGQTVAASSVNVKSGRWSKLSTTLTAKSDVDDGTLVLTPQNEGRYAFDMVSLFPHNTFKNRKNGLRRDLAQTLADIHPKFVRFPGGCVAHGDGIDNIYDWKGSIGPVEHRKPLRNLWGYHQTRGLGFYEYFQFCEDIGAMPLPVVAAGVPCQNSATPSRYSKNVVTTGGQQGGIPMSDMPAYVQDVLDLIEYANGDARKTVWGHKRAEAGHPKPFGLKYIGIGNEDLISDVFKERFAMIFKAVKAKYPDITVIGTVGPFYEGSDYDEGWKFATEQGVPMVDEHYYCQPGWFINNQHFYDGYDRKKSKVYLGEYAAQFGGAPNVESALAEAIYLINVERNADIVTMTSYAPLLAKEKRVNWNPDMIYYNNTVINPSTGYYVQQAFGQNSGDTYYPSIVKTDCKDPKANMRIAVSTVKDSKTGDVIVKMANLLPVTTSINVSLPMIKGATKASCTVFSGQPSDKRFDMKKTEINVGNVVEQQLPPYSFTVVRIQGNVK